MACTLCSASLSQTVTIGVIGGDQPHPFSINGSYTAGVNAYAVGPSVEVAWRRHFTVEVDAVRKRLTYNGIVVASFNKYIGASYEHRDARAASWEFPALLKWYAQDGPQRAFIAGGISLKRVTGTSHIYGSILSGDFVFHKETPYDYQSGPKELNHPFSQGVTAVAGIDFRAGPFHIVPQVRYTRWFNKALSNSDYNFGSNLNAFDGLVALTFGK